MNCHLQAPTSAKQGKHGRTHDEMDKILLPRYATYKEDPQIRGNGRATQDAIEDKAKAHLSVTQRKVDPGQHSLGSAEPQVWPNLDRH